MIKQQQEGSDTNEYKCKNINQNLISKIISRINSASEFLTPSNELNWKVSSLFCVFQNRSNNMDVPFPEC